jgi:hypothetical protein
MRSLGILTLVTFALGCGGSQREADRINSARILGIGVSNALEHQGGDPAKLTLRSREGKPMWGWRVAILPYMEQMMLYSKLDEDKTLAESWDSEKGRQLLKTEIHAYKTDAAPEPGTTTWKLVPRLQGGVMLVEGGEGSAVPWTQPDEVDIDGENPLASFGKEPRGGYLVVMSDTTVKRLPAQELKAKLRKPKE